jgi:hypothetical protein
LLAENVSEVAAEDVLWAARSATFALMPLGWLPFFNTHFPAKLHELLECMASGREGSNLAVIPSQEDILSTTGADRSAARVNHQLVLQELVSAISVRFRNPHNPKGILVFIARIAGCEAPVQAALCV